MTSEGLFNLFQLNAESANLDLIVVKARARIVAERIGNKLLRGEIGTVEITTCYARPTDVQLTRNAHRNRPQPGIEHIKLRICHWPADGNNTRCNARCVRAKIASRDGNRGFGWAIGVQQSYMVTNNLLPGADAIRCCLLAANDYQANALRQREILSAQGIRQFMPVSSRQIED